MVGPFAFYQAFTLKIDQELPFKVLPSICIASRGCIKSPLTSHLDGAFYLGHRQERFFEDLGALLRARWAF